MNGTINGRAVLGARHLPRELFPPLTLMLSGRILRRFPHVRLRASLPATVALPQSRGFATPSANDLFANGTNAYYAEEMYRHWKEDPKSVHPSWDVYFSGLEKGLPSSAAFQQPPSAMPAPSDGAPALHASSGAELDDHLKVCLAPFLLTHVNMLPIDTTSRSCLPSPWSPRCSA